MRKFFFFLAVSFCLLDENRADERENIIQSMQNYLIEANKIPNLLDIIRDLEKLQENCAPSQRPLVVDAVTRIRALSQVVQQEASEGEGTIQDLRKYVENICDNLNHLQYFAKGSNNQRYNQYVNYNWKKLLEVLNELLQDGNLVVELDDKLTLNNEKDLADYIIKTVENLNNLDPKESLQKKKILELAHEIIKGNLAYTDLARNIVRLTSGYNQLAEGNDFAMIRISHIRDIRDALVENFFDESLQSARNNNSTLLVNELQKQKRKYDNAKSRPQDVSNILDDTANVLGNASFDGLAWRATLLRQAVAIINSAISKNEKAYMLGM